MSKSESEGYLAVPDACKEPGTLKAPGVLVLHPWWGLNDTVRGVCDRLAEEGFIAFAPDLYHGKIATTIEEAEVLSEQLDSERASADAAAGVALLCERTGAEDCKLGVIGFSLGAYYAVQLSVDDSDRIQAVVLFYGTGEGDYDKAKAAYLGHFAETDPYEPAEYVDGMEMALAASGRPVVFHRYADLGHWFFEPDRHDAYNEPAARLAWERTLAFLKQSL
jgi:carboxymethylenebutenolidase